ncbi:hypothetical protein RFI_15414, partial [Reticulomyxa filosa]
NSSGSSASRSSRPSRSHKERKEKGHKHKSKDKEKNKSKTSDKKREKDKDKDKRKESKDERKGYDQNVTNNDAIANSNGTLGNEKNKDVNGSDKHMPNSSNGTSKDNKDLNNSSNANGGNTTNNSSAGSSSHALPHNLFSAAAKPALLMPNPATLAAFSNPLLGSLAGLNMAAVNPFGLMNPLLNPLLLLQNSMANPLASLPSTDGNASNAPMPGVVKEQMEAMYPQMTRPARRLYVGNLPIDMPFTEQILCEFFTQCCKGLGERTFGFIELRSVRDTTLCLSLFEGLQLGGRNLRFGRPMDYKLPSEELRTYLVPGPDLNDEKDGVQTFLFFFPFFYLFLFVCFFVFVFCLFEYDFTPMEEPLMNPTNFKNIIAQHKH